MKANTRISHSAPSSSTFDVDVVDEWETYRPVEASDTSESSRAFAFEDLVQRMLTSGGREKQRLADEVLERIKLDDNSRSTRAAWACYLVLQSSKPGRLGDCIGILSRLGPTTLRECLLDAIENRPPTSDDDYWFALVRTLGHLCQQGHKEIFWPVIEVASRLHFVTLREAAVYALADIGDEAARQRLQEISDNDTSLAIRDLAADCLEDVDD